MKLHPFKALYPRVEKIQGATSFFKDVKYNYIDFKKGDYFEEQREPAFYILQIEGKTRVYQGIIGCIDIEDFLTGKIKKHENILQEKEQKQINLLNKRSAIVKPILVTHPEIVELSSWIKHYIQYHSPFLELKVNQEEIHRLWSVYNPEDSQNISELIQDKLDNVYLADGHHRSSATAHLFAHQSDFSTKHKYQYYLAPSFHLINWKY